MDNQLFRKESLDQITSPEQMNDYLRVTNPAVWLLLTAVILLLAGVLLWSSIASIDSFAKGTAQVNDGSMRITFVDTQVAQSVQAGMTISVGDTTTQVSSVGYDDDGTIFIASCDIEACRAARKTIEDIVFEPEVGALYYGEVKRIISNLGAFIEIAPGKDAMCHIKDLEFKRTEKVEDVLNVGDKTWVKFIGIDDKGRWNISRKAALKERGED